MVFLLKFTFLLYNFGLCDYVTFNL